MYFPEIIRCSLSHISNGLQFIGISWWNDRLYCFAWKLLGKSRSQRCCLVVEIMLEVFWIVGFCSILRNRAGQETAVLFIPARSKAFHLEAKANRKQCSHLRTNITSHFGMIEGVKGATLRLKRHQLHQKTKMTKRNQCIRVQG